MGTIVVIEGVGRRVVGDRLSRKYGRRIDVFMATHQQAKDFGLKKRKVVIYRRRPH